MRSKSGKVFGRKKAKKYVEIVDYFIHTKNKVHLH